MIALIDSDLVAFRCAASAETDSLEVAIYRCNELMQTILRGSNATEQEGFLTGNNNFRKQLDSQYKANRTAPRPQHLEALREHLVTEWGARVTDGWEADDALGIKLTECNELGVDAICCSLDKDMRQVPGWHYGWAIGTSKWTKEEERVFVTPLDGLQTFYRQVLIGDISDNIQGCVGIGKAKSAKLINHLTDEQEMYEVCQYYFNDDERLELTCQLIYILRMESQHWVSPSKRKQLELEKQLSLPLQETQSVLG